MHELTYVYDDRYLAWRLGGGHPTNPERARNALRVMEALHVPLRVEKPRYASREELLLAHGRRYVDSTLFGRNGEWEGRRQTLGDTARLMAGGTMHAVDLILGAGDNGIPLRVFNPQGAKHHAMPNTGSGFCVFNDMVMAAHRFVRAGMKVAYLDWDVHHGDGVQAGFDRIGQDSDGTYGARTWSVFGHGFAAPDTVMLDPKGQHVHSLLEDKADDGDWLTEIDWFCTGIEDYRPDVILLATGADAHITDPLGTLHVTTEGYYAAGQMVSDLAGALNVPVLIGGAGGYQPYDWTPLCWAMVGKAMTD